MLRDVMQSAGLVIYAEIGLVLMIGAFVFLVVRSLVKRSSYYKELAKLPLDDGVALSGEARMGERSSKPSEV